MLNLSANSDFKTIETEKFENPYYDWDGLLEQPEVHGTTAIDQMIEQVLLTEPHERLFNLAFGSPLYKMLFENMTNVDQIMNMIYDIIEYWVPIKIARNDCDVQADPDTLTVSFQLPYIANSGNGFVAGIFRRRIHQ